MPSAQDTYTLYVHQGCFDTPSRLRKFEKRVGAKQLNSVRGAEDRIKVLDALECGTAMAKAFVDNSGTCCDMARDTFRHIGVSQAYMDNAQTVFSENDSLYPSASAEMLKDLTESFNAINDAEEINRLQKDIVSLVDDAGVGLALAQKVRQTIKRIRGKDALAAKICALSSTLDGCVAREEAAHYKRFSTPPGQLRKALTALIQRFESGATAETVLHGFGPKDVATFCEYFGTDGSSLGSVAEEYVLAAATSRNIEECMR